MNSCFPPVSLPWKNVFWLLFPHFCHEIMSFWLEVKELISNPPPQKKYSWVAVIFMLSWVILIVLRCDDDILVLLWSELGLEPLDAWLRLVLVLLELVPRLLHVLRLRHQLLQASLQLFDHVLLKQGINLWCRRVSNSLITFCWNMELTCDADSLQLLDHVLLKHGINLWCWQSPTPWSRFAETWN